MDCICNRSFQCRTSINTDHFFFVSNFFVDAVADTRVYKMNSNGKRIVVLELKFLSMLLPNLLRASFDRVEFKLERKNLSVNSTAISDRIIIQV